MVTTAVMAVSLPLLRPARARARASVVAWRPCAPAAGVLPADRRVRPAGANRVPDRRAGARILASRTRGAAAGTVTAQ